MAEEEETKEEDKEESIMSWRPKTQLEFYLAIVLALVVGFLIGYFIYKYLKERDEPDYSYHQEPYFYYPYIPFQPREEPKIIAHPSERKPRRSAIDIEAIRRTPEALRRHGIILDEQGEACLTGDTMYETWKIIRNDEGKIIDALKAEDDGVELEEE